MGLSLEDELKGRSFLASAVSRVRFSCVLRSPSLGNRLSLLPHIPPGPSVSSPQLPQGRRVSWHFGSCDFDCTSGEILALSQLFCVSGRPLSPHGMLCAHVCRGSLVPSIASKPHLAPYDATKWHKDLQIKSGSDGHLYLLQRRLT